MAITARNRLWDAGITGPHIDAGGSPQPYEHLHSPDELWSRFFTCSAGLEASMRQPSAGRLRPSRLRARRLPETSPSELRRRLNVANGYFSQKATEVMIDEDSVMLLADLYEKITIKIDEFDTCQNGLALARLTAANFAEIGAQVIHITTFGREFIRSLIEDDA